MKKISNLILWMSLIILSCKNTDSPKDISKTYNLLERKESLKNGKEWENIHNIYTRYTDQIRKKPNEAKSYIDLAELFMMEARVTGEHGHYYSNALALLEHAYTLAKGNKDIEFRSLSDRASVLMSLHQFVKAKQFAEDAIKLNPYNAQVYGALVDANVELGNYKEAVASADKMVSIRPDLRSYSRISYLRELFGDLTGAIEAMKQAVEAGYPGYEETAWARLHLGELYKKSGNTEAAVLEYQTVLSQRPNYAFAMAALAEVELDKKNYEQAEKLVNEAITLMPEVSFYITKAKLFEQQGKKDESMMLAQEVLTMLKDDEKSGHKMDLTYAQVFADLFKDYDQAIKYAMQEFEIRPGNIEVNKFLVDTYTKMGNLAKANQHKAKSTIEKI